MTRTVAALLLFASFAVAAPVPKDKPKIEDVFGEVADPKSQCKFEMSKDGALTVTVPTKHPALEPSSGSTTPPVVGKKVIGDFVLTVRVAIALPKTADATVGHRCPTAFAGVSVVTTDDPSAGVTVGVVRRFQDTWEGAKFVSFRGPKMNSATEDDLNVPADKPTWWRVTRRGRDVSVETSDEGTKWERFANVGGNVFDDTTSVGPVAFGTIDKEFTATFDRYEIKPLKKDEKK